MNQMKFLLLFFLLPLRIFGQSAVQEDKDITGVWTGSLYNDTTQKYIHYELAINETNGKLNGYSHTTFIIDGVKNIGVKEVKIKWKKGIISVDDEKLIDNDYTAPPAKGVRTLIEFVFLENDSTDILQGTWKTNRTKEYNAITGTVRLERDKKVWQTLIIPKLEQLGLAGNLSFLTRDKSSQSSIAIAENLKQNNSKNSGIEKAAAQINPVIQESGKIIPDTTITDPELVVKIYGPIKKKAIIATGSTNSTVANNNVAKNAGTKTENPLQKQNAEIKNGAVLKASIDKREDARTENNFKPATLDSNSVLSKNNKKEIADNSQKPTIDKPLPSKNKTASTEELVVRQEKETFKIEAGIKKGQQKTDSVFTDNGRKQVTPLNKNSQQKVFAVVDNKSVKKEEDNDKNSRNAKNKIESDSVKLNAEFASKSAPKEDSITITKRKNETKQSGEIEKKIASGQDSGKSQISEKGVVKAKGNLGQNENVQSSINSLNNKTTNAAAEIAKRDIETIRTVEVAQDSLILSLYDNGTIDGDTVSILVNGEVVMPKVGLLARAVNKTIYLTPEMGDSIRVIMYAENLGTFPPNTGLLIVRDGDINYEIRFSGDLQKNSAIILKRKKSKIEH